MADRPWSGPVAPGGWDDAALEAALRDLGERLIYPATPDLAAAVRRRLAAAPEPPDSWWRRLLAWWAGLTPRRAVATAAVALLLLAVLVVTVVPPTRETVAGWLGVRGIRIVFVDETPTPAPTPTVSLATPAATATPASLGGSLLLGERLTLAEAQALVDFPLAVPSLPLLGEPDEVYLRHLPDGPMVALLYYPRPGLPATAETGVGLLLVQFAAPEEGIFWQTKEVTRANRVGPARVNDTDGLWLEGSHSLMIAPDPVSRPAGNVLLWELDGVTYRLESDLSQTRAVAVAETLAPLPEATPAPGPATPRS